MGFTRERMWVAGAFLLLAAITPGRALAQTLGEIGESCRARSDCQEGLRCVDNTCRGPDGTECESDVDCGDGGSCQDGDCVEDAEEVEAAEVGTAQARDDEGVDAGGDDEGGEEESEVSWADFRLGGTHFFAGLTFAPGLTGYWPYGGNLPVWASFFFAFKFGVLFNRAELSMELSPATWIWDFDPGQNSGLSGVEGNRNSLSFLVNIGGYVQLADNVYWPFRFGLGLSAHELPRTSVYMQGRLDLIGLVYHYGHLMFEINLPSIRFHSEFQTMGIWGWLFTLSISYIV